VKWHGPDVHESILKIPELRQKQSLDRD